MGKKRNYLPFFSYLVSFLLILSFLVAITHFLTLSHKSLGLPKETFIPRFPWPPPKASAYVIIPREFLVKTGTRTLLEDIALKIEKALDTTGYAERSYYYVPKGFALVTRLEQIFSDGTPRNGVDRWSIDYSRQRVFSLSSYLKALFKANPGHYRIIVFIITSYPFNQAGSTVDRDSAMKWLHGGLNVLPPEIGKWPYTSEYDCTALIYEFEQISVVGPTVFKDPSLLTGKMHLEKAKIWQALKE